MSHSRDIFIGGQKGIAPIEIWQRSKIWYVARSSISARNRSNFGNSLNIFWMFCEILYLDLWATRRTERSAILDLLIKIPGPLNPAAYWKVHNFFKRSKICPKKVQNLKPPRRFDEHIPAQCLRSVAHKRSLPLVVDRKSRALWFRCWVPLWSHHHILWSPAPYDLRCCWGVNRW